MKKIQIKNFFCPENIGFFQDSMQLDSGQELINLKVEIENLNIEASVRIYGDVRVIFRDNIYKCASQMPDELLECYRKRLDPEILATSNGKNYKIPYYCNCNNWLEESIIVYDKNGKIVDDSFSEVIDFIDNNTPEGWKKMLLHDVKTVMSQYP